MNAQAEPKRDSLPHEMLWKSDCTQEQIERFEIGDARFAYSEKV
ncbi:hypothetical protein [Helicobacter himalayensis]|nr:hypothetical protein [Helicobacter himalayensis]